MKIISGSEESILFSRLFLNFFHQHMLNRKNTTSRIVDAFPFSGERFGLRISLHFHLRTGTDQFHPFVLFAGSESRWTKHSSHLILSHIHF